MARRRRSCLAASATNPPAIYGLVQWMNTHGLVKEARSWLAHTPNELRALQPVPLAWVESYFATREWPELESFLQNQKWADLEFLRFAFLSQAAAEQRQKLTPEFLWERALRETDGNLAPLISLLDLATHWKRDKAREEVLWQIGRRFPKEQWALRELDQSYARAGNTLALNKLYAALATRDSTDYIIQNNLAATSLLLKLNLPRANDLAKTLYAEHPGEPIIASTFAYSLHLQGRTSQALAVLDKLPPESLERPAVAFYYGVLLRAAGESDKARHYLALAPQTLLLPEEKALLAQSLFKSPIEAP